MNYEYINLTEGETWPANATQFETDVSLADPDGLARDAAEDEDSYLGPDYAWPIDLEIFADGYSVGVFHVERIHAPTFVAIRCSEFHPDQEVAA